VDAFFIFIRISQIVIKVELVPRAIKTESKYTFFVGSTNLIYV
jgi:hypothetical protein